MNAYVFQAALLCDECAGYIARSIIKEIGEFQANSERYDSDLFPCGPYPDGGGEADTPQHCDHCHVFLENPLTGDGYEYVIEALLNYRAGDGGSFYVLTIWFGEYGSDIDMDEVLKPQAPEPIEAGSPYLNLPLRTEEQARRDLAAQDRS